MSSHFTTTPASDGPGLPKPLPSLARASRLKPSPSLQNVSATLTGLNCRCNWCVTDMRARCPLGPHVSNPMHLQLSHRSSVRIHARRTYSGASRPSIYRGSLPFSHYINLSPSSQPEPKTHTYSPLVPSFCRHHSNHGLLALRSSLGRTVAGADEGHRRFRSRSAPKLSSTYCCRIRRRRSPAPPGRPSSPRP